MTPVDDLAETRDVTVGSSVQRHQLRQYLKASKLEWVEPWRATKLSGTFTITATPEQWEGINQWLQRTKVD